MAVLVTAASVSDPAGARLLFARLGGACKKLRLIWVDGTYRGQLVEWVAQHMRFLLRVTLRPEGLQRLCAPASPMGRRTDTGVAQPIASLEQRL